MMPELFLSCDLLCWSTGGVTFSASARFVLAFNSTMTFWVISAFAVICCMPSLGVPMSKHSFAIRSRLAGLTLTQVLYQ